MTGFTINPPRTPLTDGRGQITPEWYRFLSRSNDIGGAPYLTVTGSVAVGNARTFTPIAGQLVATDGGAGLAYTVALAPTTVVPGTYGAADKTVAFTVDSKGRLTMAAQYALNTDNVTEGATNLYFTQARARASLSASSGIVYNSGTGAFTAAPAGAYGAPTGTLSRAALASYVAGTGLTYSAGYVQAELTATGTRIAAIEAALATLSQTVAALITDMRANNNLS